MSISFRKYVDIISGVGGAAQAAERELILRMITSSVVLPTNSFVEFTDLESVGDFFGFENEAFFRAQFYFGFISKLTTTPKKISFARWAEVDVPPFVFGSQQTQDLADWTPITDGEFKLTLGATTVDLLGLDFSLDASLADVAATIEAAVQAGDAAAVWTGATVLYVAAANRFTLLGGDAGNFPVVIANVDGAGTDIAAMAGWLDTQTRLSDGIVAQSITEVLTTTASASNNFGSFAFMGVLAGALDEAQIVEAATWAKGENVRYQFYNAVLEADAQTTYDAVSDIGATGIMIKDELTPTEFPELMPAAILAATDYNRRNANQNYMFNQFAIRTTVDDTQTSNTLDAIRMNYYGETQQAGSQIAFFQRGLLMGLAADPLDMNTFANEQWFKDAAGVAFMNLLLALPALPANKEGEGIGLATLDGVIERALFNAVISIGKALNDTQKAFILQVTGDENAATQIEDIGYWVSVSIAEDTQNPGEFILTYILLYSKADVVRKISGVHTLI